MQDDFHTAAWADHHAAVSTAIHKAIRTIMFGIERLNARRSDAPWKQQRRRAYCAVKRSRA